MHYLLSHFSQQLKRFTFKGHLTFSLHASAMPGIFIPRLCPVSTCCLSHPYIHALFKHRRCPLPSDFGLSVVCHSLAVNQPFVNLSSANYTFIHRTCKYPEAHGSTGSINVNAQVPMPVRGKTYAAYIRLVCVCGRRARRPKNSMSHSLVRRQNASSTHSSPSPSRAQTCPHRPQEGRIVPCASKHGSAALAAQLLLPRSAAGCTVKLRKRKLPCHLPRSCHCRRCSPRRCCSGQHLGLQRIALRRGLALVGAAQSTSVGSRRLRC